MDLRLLRHEVAVSWNSVPQQDLFKAFIAVLSNVLTQEGFRGSDS